jgi:hypothetical protein
MVAVVVVVVIVLIVLMVMVVGCWLSDVGYLPPAD